MSTLHMNVESIVSLIRQIEQTRNVISGKIESLHENIDTTIESNWMGPSASKFCEEYKHWHTEMQSVLQKLEALADKLDAEMQEWESMASLLDVAPPENLKDSRQIREWWHNILRNHGKYSCYAILLVLPSDKEAIKYLTDFGRELDLISGDMCLVFTFGDIGVKRPGFEDSSWVSTVENHVKKGLSVDFADLFDIQFSNFPCLVVFNDIRSPKHIVITLNGLTAEEIADKLRFTFSIIKKAIQNNQDPLEYLVSKHKEESFYKASKSIISEIRSFAGKTVEMAVEAAIKAITSAG